MVPGSDPGPDAKPVDPARATATGPDQPQHANQPAAGISAENRAILPDVAEQERKKPPEPPLARMPIGPEYPDMQRVIPHGGREESNRRALLSSRDFPDFDRQRIMQALAWLL